MREAPLPYAEEERIMITCDTPLCLASRQLLNGVVVRSTQVDGSPSSTEEWFKREGKDYCPIHGKELALDAVDIPPAADRLERARALAPQLSVWGPEPNIALMVIIIVLLGIIAFMAARQ